MNELSLFTGAGGGVYGAKLLGHRIVGYVEWDKYCQQVIAARIRDSIFDDAPIFGDIRSFISDGYAESYQGLVDIITGGFPCQPFSLAGRQKGGDDERNMWPATAECSGLRLAGQVMWPTPTKQDGENNGGPSQFQRNSIPLNAVVLGGQPTPPNQTTPSSGVLNPEWVEWLMGWPIGATALEPLAMGRFQAWLRLHSGY